MMKDKILQFKSKEDKKRHLKYADIMCRATVMGLMSPDEDIDRMMDIESADGKFNLRLDDWFDADDFNFAHDFIGIRDNINRNNGFPTTDFGFFVPRFAGHMEDRMNNYEVCKCVESVGSIAVYVKKQCKKAHMLKGKFAVTKKECQRCTPIVAKKKEVPKCSECEFKEFEGRKCGPNRYYCKNPDARFARGETEQTPMICRTERHNNELTIKTSPRWCPRRKK